jgi:hypothetical protein
MARIRNRLNKERRVWIVLEPLPTGGCWKPHQPQCRSPKKRSPLGERKTHSAFLSDTRFAGLERTATSSVRRVSKTTHASLCPVTVILDRNATS